MILINNFHNTHYKMIFFWAHVCFCTVNKDKSYQALNNTCFIDEVENFHKFQNEKWNEFEKKAKQQFIEKLRNNSGEFTELKLNIQKFLPKFDKKSILESLEKSVDSFLRKYTKQKDENSFLIDSIVEEFGSYYNSLREKTCELILKYDFNYLLHLDEINSIQARETEHFLALFLFEQKCINRNIPIFPYYFKNPLLDLFYCEEKKPWTINYVILRLQQIETIEILEPWKSFFLRLSEVNSSLLEYEQNILELVEIPNEFLIELQGFANSLSDINKQKCNDIIKNFKNKYRWDSQKYYLTGSYIYDYKNFDPNPINNVIKNITSLIKSLSDNMIGICQDFDQEIDNYFYTLYLEIEEKNLQDEKLSNHAKSEYKKRYEFFITKMRYVIYNHLFKLRNELKTTFNIFENLRINKKLHISKTAIFYKNLKENDLVRTWLDRICSKFDNKDIIMEFEELYHKKNITMGEVQVFKEVLKKNESCDVNEITKILTDKNLFFDYVQVYKVIISFKTKIQEILTQKETMNAKYAHHQTTYSEGNKEEVFRLFFDTLYFIKEDLNIMLKTIDLCENQINKQQSNIRVNQHESTHLLSVSPGESEIVSKQDDGIQFKKVYNPVERKMKDDLGDSDRPVPINYKDSMLQANTGTINKHQNNDNGVFKGNDTQNNAGPTEIDATKNERIDTKSSTDNQQDKRKQPLKTEKISNGSEIRNSINNEQGKRNQPLNTDQSNNKTSIQNPNNTDQDNEIANTEEKIALTSPENKTTKNNTYKENEVVKNNDLSKTKGKNTNSTVIAGVLIFSFLFVSFGVVYLILKKLNKI